MTVQGINNPGSIQGLDPDGSSMDPTSTTGGIDPCGALLPAPSVVTGGMGDIGAEIALLSLQAGHDEELINTTAERAENNHPR